MHWARASSLVAPVAGSKVAAAPSATGISVTKHEKSESYIQAAITVQIYNK